MLSGLGWHDRVLDVLEVVGPAIIALPQRMFLLRRRFLGQIKLCANPFLEEARAARQREGVGAMKNSSIVGVLALLGVFVVILSE